MTACRRASPRGRPCRSARAAPRPVTATVTLSYLATGFDWQANYVATLSPDGTRLGLFAWLTLANGDETGFANADTQAVAGHLNRARDAAPAERRRPAQPHLLAAGHDQRHPARGAGGAEDIGVMDGRLGYADGAAATFAAAATAAAAAAPLIAQQEELGDLKLYRIPEPVTVAAHSQKQVALLQRDGVRVGIVYRQRLYPTDAAEARPAQRFLVTRNRSNEGLGLPLPAGRLMLFSEGARADPARPGHARRPRCRRGCGDRLGPAPGVETRLTTRRGARTAAITSSSSPATAPSPSASRPRSRRRTGGLRGGGPAGAPQRLSLWSVIVPANGSATLHYSLERQR